MNNRYYKSAQHVFPIIGWLSVYNRATLLRDMMAAVIVTIMLVPQSLAYAQLAGLPAVVGLYTSILPLLAYALIGSSRVLAVGPVAVISLMTASSLGNLALANSAQYAGAAVTLAALSGFILLILGILRLGFFANFLSHPVISGFITASGILIAAGQFKHILGIKASGENLPEIVMSLWASFGATNKFTLALGFSAIFALLWVRSGFAALLQTIGMHQSQGKLYARTGPVFVLATSALAAWYFALAGHGVKLVGAIPTGLPSIVLPDFSFDVIKQLALPALLISIVGFVESMSIAQTLAAKRRQHINPNQELIALGASNLAASMSSGFPVTGGFARSVVNFDAGAETPAAGAFTAIGLIVASLYLTPLLAYLPQATLAATIIVAVLSLVDFGILRRTWHFAKSDFAAVAITIFLTLTVGVESGLIAGVLMSILIHLYRTSKPHIAIVGRVAGTEHFRNIKRHDVEIDPTVLTLRIDESLYFANARFLENQIFEQIVAHPEVKHIILMCPAVNDIDISALERLESINNQLHESGITLHLSEVKGPVMDKLNQSGFLSHLKGEVFLSQHLAIATLQKQKTALA